MGAVAYLTNFMEILLPIVAYKWPKFSLFSGVAVANSQRSAVAYNQHLL